MRLTRPLAAALLLVSAIATHAADAQKGQQAESSKPMRMDEPMAGEMKRKSMKKGDVKKAAEKKQREIKAMIEKESAVGAKK